MNLHMLIFGFFIIATAIMSIATSSIAIQCYNKCDNPNMNTEHPRNKTFLIINLIMSIGMVFASFYIFKMAMVPSINFGGMGGLGGGMGGIGGDLSRLF